MSENCLIVDLFVCTLQKIFFLAFYPNFLEDYDGIHEVLL